jgi:hypothetical protein
MTETLVTTATRCTCAHTLAAHPAGVRALMICGCRAFTPAPDQPAPAESDPVEPGESS